MPTDVSALTVQSLERATEVLEQLDRRGIKAIVRIDTAGSNASSPATHGS